MIGTVGVQPCTLLNRVQHVLHDGGDGRHTGRQVVNLVLQVGVRVGAGRGLGIKVVLKRAVGHSACGSLVGDGGSVRGDVRVVGGNTGCVGRYGRVVSGVGSSTSRSLIGNGRRVGGDVRVVGGNGCRIRSRTGRVGGNGRRVRRNGRVVGGIGSSAIRSLLGSHRSEAVSRRLGRTRSVQCDRNGSHGQGPERFESITTVDFHLEFKTTVCPIDRRQAAPTFDTADGEVDQAELVGHDTVVCFRPNGGTRHSIGQSEANVQGCKFQGITVRIAGNGLVSNPIVLLGLNGENRHQHNCGQEE